MDELAATSPTEGIQDGSPTETQGSRCVNASTSSALDDRRTAEEKCRSIFEGAHPENIRASRVGAIMRNMCSVMAQTEVESAWWASEESYNTMSEPMQKIRYFLSHAWAASRWAKYMQLVLVFNLRGAAIVSFQVACAGAALLFVGADYVLHFETVRASTGVVGYALGSITFYLALMFWADVADRCCGLRSATMFLDKFCINQVSDAEKEKGIMALGAALKSSESLVVLLTPNYMKRLWTVCELACFTAVHSTQSVLWVPEMISPLVFASSLIMNVSSLMVSLSTASNLTSMRGADAARICSGALCLVGFTCGSYLYRRWVEMKYRIEHELRNFEIRNAECTNESDREIVSDLVHALGVVFGGEGPSPSKEDSLDRFNGKVRRDVTEAFSHSLGRNGVQYEHVCAAAWTEVLWMPGQCAAMWYQATSWWNGLIFLLLHSCRTFCIFPLGVALLCYLSRTGLGMRHRWYIEMSYCVVCAMIATLVCVATIWVMMKLASEAQLEDSSFGVLVLAASILSAMTFFAYRPRRSPRRD